ncbi:MAG: hypothetical protein ACRCYR_13320 [Phycicoccus sp.]
MTVDAADLVQLDEPGPVRDAASGLIGAFLDVRAHSFVVRSTWAGLSGVYQAPEQGELLAAMEAPAVQASEAAEKAITAGRALSVYADRLEELHAKREALAADIGAFYAEKARIDAENRDNNVFEDIADHWNGEGTQLLDREEELNARAGELQAEKEAAERDCASAVGDIWGAPRYEAADETWAGDTTTYGLSAAGYEALSRAGDAPWGRPSMWDSDNWGVRFAMIDRGAGESITGALGFLGDLVGFGGSGRAKAGWSGLWQLAVDGHKTSPLGLLLYDAGDVQESAERLVGVGKGIVGWDNWDASGWYAGGSLGLDVVLTAASVGAAGAVKGSIRGAAATRFARLLELDGSVNVRAAAAAAQVRLSGPLGARLGSMSTAGSVLAARLEALAPAGVPRTLLDDVGVARRDPTPAAPRTSGREVPDLTSRGPGSPGWTTPDTTPGPRHPVDPARPPHVAGRSGSGVDDAPPRSADDAPPSRPADRSSPGSGAGGDGRGDASGHGDNAGEIRHGSSDTDAGSPPGQVGGVEEMHAVPEKGVTDGAVPDAPDGGLTHDRYGRAYVFDHTGYRHLPGDPPGSYRDINGALHDPVTGRYATDPNTPDLDGYEFADRAKPYDADLTNPDTAPGGVDEVSAAHQEHLTARNDAATAHRDALALRDGLARNAGIDPKALTAEGAKKHLDGLVQDGLLDKSAARQIKDAARDAQSARTALSAASERFGEDTVSLLAESRRESTLVAPGRVGAGRFDEVSLGGEPPHLTFYEAKGGNSTLGSGRIVDGVRHQQGTTGYLTDVARVDPRFRVSITEYLTRPDADPDLVKAITDGTVEVRYEMVQALPNGRVKITPFKLDPAALRLPGVGP